MFQGAGYLKRADTDKLHEIFLKYATVDKNGEKYITSEDFVRKFLGLFDEGKVFLGAHCTYFISSYGLQFYPRNFRSSKNELVSVLNLYISS